ncbi:unnamed protein product [Urochloa humidicola]
MTITGKLNAEEDTIFLKVQIADDTGNNVRNIYFPFDLVSDTATEVAQEMVKELSITDRDPSEIAAMIHQEIQRLLPEREQQHEYTYEAHDDDDDGNEERPPLFCYLSSSPTSSQGSLCGVGPYTSTGFSGPNGGGWSKDYGYYALSDDDDLSSMHSGESSSRSPGRANTAQQSSSSSLARQLQRQCSMSPQHGGRPRRREADGRRMTRNRSMVDMRSQLLHRTLVEELNRRLFFNTVGAVENIGFRDPTATANSSSSSAARGSRRSSKDDKHHRHQYVML